MSEIPNALTPEEWKGRHVFLFDQMMSWEDEDGNEIPDYALTVLIDSDGLCIHCKDSFYSTDGIEPKDTVAIMALANAALPDDDPRKITRRDVYILQKAAEFIDDTEDVDGPLSTYVRALAAKLAALLPPE